ncbi:HNH endonuclease [Microbulbifer sp. SH-1]|uniref:HNH endonuclease n=1 Tax=Microbulbifer sp. SH-1 TaxID=2681547 RepID=UPI00197C4186|nr:HNH endonuclease [Microbulbifer sp. SH-1]
MARPAIPVEIKRAVLVEAGHRCAIPRCGETELDVHHIVPWETCQKHEYSNLIALCPICHRRAHKGEIDRKALFQYKAALTAGSGPGMQANFEAPIVEIRRRIFENNTDVPGYTFQFDFPDFEGLVQRIVSKNIEAWGYELLADFRHHQETFIPVEAERDTEIESFYKVPSHLSGSYRIIRNDDVVISLEYTLDRFFTGSAHGGRSTRVQNFLVSPFQPITAKDLLAENSSLVDLSELVRSRLLSNRQYSEKWVVKGTEPKDANFSKFVLEKNGIQFIFDEYQIDCYAAGRQKLWIGYDQFSGIGKPSLFSKLASNDF